MLRCRGLRREASDECSNEQLASKVRLLSIEGSTTGKLPPANLAALCTFLFNGYGILQASKRGAFSRANLPIRDRQTVSDEPAWTQFGAVLAINCRRRSRLWLLLLPWQAACL